MTAEHTRAWPRLPGQRVGPTARAPFRPAFAPESTPVAGPTAHVVDRDLSLMLTERLDTLLPAGATTSLRGTSVFPDGRAPVVARGQGAHVWDVDGNRYVELGNPPVALGHQHPRVTDAVRAAIQLGESFVRPAALEVDAAEALLAVVPDAEMVAFVGSDADADRLVASLGRSLTGSAPLVVDAAASADLPASRRRCDEQGVLLVLDERATAFRRTPGAADVEPAGRPDLRILGGALGNGFAVAAVTGPRRLLRHARVERGAESHALAAATAVVEAHRKEDVVATLDWVGRFLADQVRDAVAAVGLHDHVVLSGPPSDLRYIVLDDDGRPSSTLRSVMLASMLDHGVLAPSLTVSTALTDHDVQHVADAAHHAAQAIRLALG